MRVEVPNVRRSRLALAAGLGWSSTRWVGVGLAGSRLVVLATADARRTSSG